MSTERETRARRRIRLAVEAKGYRLTELTWESWGRAAEKEGIPGGWEGYVEPEPRDYFGGPAVMGLSVREALEWIEQFLPALPAVLRESEAERMSAERETPIVPDFDKCGRCGADAKTYCSWDPAGGWCCSSCGGCDSDE